MNRTLFLFALALAAVTASVTRPAEASAQSSAALVYCHADERQGCQNIATAIKTGAITTVDTLLWTSGGAATLKRQNGTSSTVSGATDFGVYSVIVVPSYANTARYDGLRNATVAGRLLAAVGTGRVAGWSGPIDQNTAQSTNKTQLLRNLTSWGGQGAGTGLFFLLDQNETLANRYNWLQGIAGVSAAAETAGNSCNRNYMMNTTGASGTRGVLQVNDNSPAGVAALAGLSSAANGEGNVTLAYCGFLAPSNGATDVIGDGGGNQNVMVTFRAGSTKAGTSISAVSGAGVYGGDATLTATLSPAVAGKTIKFEIENVWVADVTTNASGVASATFALGPNRNAGDYSLKAIFVEDATHLGSSNDQGTLTVAKAEATVSFTSISPESLQFGGTYVPVATTNGDGQLAITADGACAISGGTVTMTSGVGMCTISASAAAGTNYFAAPAVTQTITAERATGSVSFTTDNPGTLVFNGTYTPQTSNAGDGSVTLSVGAGDACSISGGVVTMTSGVGSCTVTAVLAETDNYTSDNAEQTFTADRASAQVTLGNLSQTFGATSPVTATTDPANLSVSFTFGGNPTQPINAGSYAVVATIVSDDYAGSATGTLVIGRANQAITFSTNAPTGAVFNDVYAVAATGGASGNDVVFGATGACSIEGGAVRMNGVGDCTVTADQAGNDNYDAAPQVSQTFAVGKATATVQLGTLSFTYNGQPQGTTATTTPGNLNVSITYNGTADAPTNAGEYSVVATINDDHYQGSANGTLNIGRAVSTTVVTFEAGPYTYRGSAYTATAQVTGMGLNQPVAVSYSGDCTNVSSADGCTATANFAGDDNHELSSDSKSITITRANAVIDVQGTSVTYNGSAHGATGSATGVNGEPLSGLNLGDSFTNAPGGTANWSFTGGTNYNDANGSVEIEIGKALTTTVVTCTAGPFIYNGSPHTPCSVAVTGANLSLTPAPDYTNNVNAGTATASYTYAESMNHLGSDDSKTFTISPASVPNADITLGNLVQQHDGNVKSVTVTTNPAAASVGANISYTQNDVTASPRDVGVYKVEVTLTGNYTGTAEGFLVIFDPTAGFVTGGGWIDSPVGACTLATCTDQTVGRANFGFNARYRQGANQPDGQTQFQFQAGGINFHSTSYDWLVVAGQSRAQFKGEGRIQGDPRNFGFMITVIDGTKPGGGNRDRFRMKIWVKDPSNPSNESQVVYDNQRGSGDDAGLNDWTELRGGNVRIQRN